MKRLTEQLGRDKALRDEAWSVVKGDVDLMLADLEERGVGGRMADHAATTARNLAGSALRAANEHRGWLGAATLGALLWLARGPLLSRLRPDDAPPSDNDEPQE